MPRLTPYLRLFRLPGARAFTAGNLIARLPMGMFSVSADHDRRDATAPTALAGAVTATGLAATAVAGAADRAARRPPRARPGAVPARHADRRPRPRSLLLLSCRTRRPRLRDPLRLTTAATATTPNTGGMSRARWAHLCPVTPTRCTPPPPSRRPCRRACYMLGPVAADVLSRRRYDEKTVHVLHRGHAGTRPPPRPSSLRPPCDPPNPPRPPHPAGSAAARPRTTGAAARGVPHHAGPTRPRTVALVGPRHRTATSAGPSSAHRLAAGSRPRPSTTGRARRCTPPCRPLPRPAASRTVLLRDTPP
ncbi:hypothetical protein SVIOM74S_10297 [Streptomyces violarus]